MNNQGNNTDKSDKQKDSDGMLEKIARAIDPPSREVSDAELIDPGANSPAGKPSHLSNPPAPDPKASDSPPKDKPQP